MACYYLILYYFSHSNYGVDLGPDSTLTGTTQYQMSCFTTEGQLTLCEPQVAHLSHKMELVTPFSASNSLWTLNYMTYVIGFYIFNDIPFYCITTCVHYFKSLIYLFILKEITKSQSLFSECSVGNKCVEL